MKRLLIHSFVFWPDGVSTAYLYTDIAKAFLDAGWDVTVLTTTPHFNPPAVASGESAADFAADGRLRIRRVPMRRFSHLWARVLAFAWWHLASFFIALFSRRPDVILSPSPPPSVGLLNVWLGWFKRCKVVYNVQEIYPDIIKNLHGLPLRVLRWMERSIYDGSDAVVTIDQVFRDTIAPRFKDPSHLHIIPNFVDTEFYRPLDGGVDGGLREGGSDGRQDRLHLLYAGNIGWAQDWDMLIALAERTRDLAIEYQVIGDGLRKQYLLDEIASRGLRNICVFPYQPRERMPELLAACDICFIFMDPQMDRQGFPSKVYSIMACGKPLLVSSGEGTPIVNFLRDKGCARLETDPDVAVRLDGMAAWLESLSQTEQGLNASACPSGICQESLSRMGEGGRAIIEAEYSRERVTAQYVKLMEDLTR